MKNKSGGNKSGIVADDININLSQHSICFYFSLI